MPQGAGDVDIYPDQTRVAAGHEAACGDWSIRQDLHLDFLTMTLNCDE